MDRTAKTTAKIRTIVRRIGGGLLAGAFLAVALGTTASADVPSEPVPLEPIACQMGTPAAHDIKTIASAPVNENVKVAASLR